ncbi:MAG: hypothetical protein ACI9R3_006480 [Verrucomicrobiales bacterium]|jgi:hypothetical protein
MVLAAAYREIASPGVVKASAWIAVRLDHIGLWPLYKNNPYVAIGHFFAINLRTHAVIAHVRVGTDS